MHPVYRSRPPFSRWLALTLGALPLARAQPHPPLARVHLERAVPQVVREPAAV